MNKRTKNLISYLLVFCMMVTVFSGCDKKKKDKDDKPSTSEETITEETSESSDETEATTVVTPTPTVEATPTPEPEPEDTPTPTPEPENTPTPSPEPENTPTPDPEPEDTPTPEPEPDPEDTPTPEPEPDPEPETQEHYAMVEYTVDVNVIVYELLNEDQKKTWPHGYEHFGLETYVEQYKVQLKDGAEYHSTNPDDYMLEGVLESHKQELQDRAIKSAGEFYKVYDHIELMENYDFVVTAGPTIVEFCD